MSESQQPRPLDDDPDARAAAQRAAQARNRRAGLALFAVYLALYAGFMAWNVVDPSGMARPVLLGANLAIVYGFGLIAAALVLALLYVAICNRPVAPGGES